MPMKFRSHDTFFIRKGWLSKGMRCVKEKPDLFVDKEENPMDILGIGSNMVKALRYWLQAVGLTEEPSKGKRTQSFTPLGQLIYDHDTYIEELGTLHLLQYRLASQAEEATAWYYFFNEFAISEFSREDYVEGLQKYIRMSDEESEVAIRSLNDDFACIVNTYLPRYKSNPGRVSPENNIDCPFGELGLIDVLNKRKETYISPFEHNAVTRMLHHFEASGQIRVFNLSVDQKTLVFDLERIRYQFAETRPDLVIMSHASNVIGLITPAEVVLTLAKSAGAVTVVDMAQTAGLIDLNVGLESIDFAVFAGHKTLMGPTGISGFVINPGFDLPPVLFGGTGYDSANQNMPSSLPERYEMGTLNTVGVAGLNAALKWLKQTGIAKVHSEEEQKRTELLSLLREYNFLHPIGVVPEREYVGIVSVLMDGISSDAAGSIFSERGISVRTGLQCAPKAHQFLGTFPAGTIRFSVNCLTRDDDFTVLKEALDDIEVNL